MGDIFVLVSNEQEKGVLLELKGKGCRQYENFLLAQHRSWYDFLMDALVEGGVIKRLDLAINDMVGILDAAFFFMTCCWYRYCNYVYSASRKRSRYPFRR